jgi:hypothetical protein
VNGLFLELNFDGKYSTVFRQLLMQLVKFQEYYRGLHCALSTAGGRMKHSDLIECMSSEGRLCNFGECIFIIRKIKSH